MATVPERTTRNGGDARQPKASKWAQFCPVLIYPGWAFTVLCGGLLTLLFYVTVYPLLWLLFWPVRAHQKTHHPEDYAANRAKYAR